MSTTTSQISEISPTIGVQPYMDKTNLNTEHWTFCDKIRFRNGSPEAVGNFGYVTLDTASSALMLNSGGKARNFYSQYINGKLYNLIGKSNGVYSYNGSVVTNITPLQDTSTAIPNSLSTVYTTLANNPISVFAGSTILVIYDVNAPLYSIGDTITISGSTDIGGILAANINGARKIWGVSTDRYYVSASASATSTTTGGGASVVSSSGLVKVTMSTTGFANYNRFKISGATAFGGITAPQINAELFVRGLTGTYFYVMTSGVATSSVTAAGGASIVIYNQIPSGAMYESIGSGYGMGYYGAGLYGVSKQSSSVRKYARVWSFARFGDYILMTPGDGGYLYYWDGSLTTAPVRVTNSPSNVNYMFVSDNTVVCFGKNGFENRITTSDQGNLFNWTATDTNQVYDDNIEGAGRLISHISVNDTNIIFTAKKCYTFKHIGLPNVWDIKPLSDNIGIISQRGGVAVNNIAYWMDSNNWYRWTGGAVEVMPANSQPRSTIINYVYDNINVTQLSTAFCWYNPKYEEIRWHYASTSSVNDTDKVAVTNVVEKTWWMDTSDSTCVESPEINSIYPYSVNNYLSLLNFEMPPPYGTSKTFTLTSNFITAGKKEVKLVSIIPDSYQTGSINVKVDMYQWPQSTTPISSKTYTVTADNKRIETTQNGRYWKYTISGSTTTGWNMGKWFEEKQLSGDGA